MAGSSLIGNLAVTLGLNTAAFSRGAAQAETRAKMLQSRLAGVSKSVASFGAALGIGIGVSAIVGLTRNAFDMAAALDESSQKMGVTVEALQELNLAATQSGVSQESLAGAMAKLNKNMGLLQQGSKQAVDAFAKLGLSADDLKGKSPDQALRIIADRLNALPDVQQRVAIGAQLMGRGFSELLPLINGGSKALDDYANKSQRQGQITTEEAKRLDELADSWERLKVTIGVAAAKIIAMFAELSSKADAWTLNWYANRDAFIAAAGQLASSVVSSVSNMVTAIGQAITGRLNAIWDGAKAKIEAVKNAFKNMYDAVVGHSYVPDMIEGIGQSMAELQRIMVDPAMSATEKVGSAFQSLAGLVGNLFGGKAGSIVGALGQLATSLAPIFGAKAGPLTTSPIYPDVGFARGGSGVFGGRSGVDRNLLSLNGSPIARVSRGEHFSVSPANDRGRAYFDLRGAVMTQDLVNQMNRIGAVATGAGAMLGASGGAAAVARRGERRFP